jgi:hypothetical protein
MALGSTQPLTEISIRNFFWGVKGCRRVRLRPSLSSVSRLSENVGASTSHSPKSLHGLYRNSFILSFLLRRDMCYIEVTNYKNGSATAW